MAVQYVNITIHPDDAAIVQVVKDKLHNNDRGFSQAIQFIIREYPILNAQVEKLKAEIERLKADRTRKGARA